VLVVVSVFLVSYVGLFDKIVGGSYVVIVDFGDFGGIFIGVEVIYCGVIVGKVDWLRFIDGGVFVDLRFERGMCVFCDIIVVVENCLVVGE